MSEVHTHHLLQRVKQAILEHLEPTHADFEVYFSDLLSRVKQIGRLPFDNISDPGIRVECILFAQHRKDWLPPLPLDESKQELQYDSQKFNCIWGREEVREAAWLVAGHHGFAARTDMPELRELIAHTCMLVHNSAVTQAADDRSIADDVLKKRLYHDYNLLFQHLTPQLRICLLAEVAAAFLLPGHPLPPDTAEHGAALAEFVRVATKMAIEEVQPLNSYLGHTQAEAEAALKQYLTSHERLQMHVAGHDLLELVCQLIDKQCSSCDGIANSSSSSRNSHTGDAAASEARNMQLAALEKLLWGWQPVLRACTHLLQQQHSKGASDNSSSSDVVLQGLLSQCLDQCIRVMCNHGVDEITEPDLTTTAAMFPAQVLAAACQSPELVADNLHSRRLQPLDPEQAAQLPAAVVSSQLHVLCGALVMQFVRDARAAGGAAWHQEVPLQTVVLLGVLEQVQGMMAAAAVRQKDVADAALTAKERADWLAAVEQAEAADAAELSQQQARRERLSGSQLQQIPVVECSSSDDEDQDTHVLQQQQTGHHHQQQPTRSAAGVRQVQTLRQFKPSKPHDANPKVLLALHKILHLLQLVRQFSEVNRALSESSAALAVSGTGQATVKAGPMSCEGILSVGGPVQSKYSEPRTLNAWLHPEGPSVTTVAAEDGDIVSCASTDHSPTAAAAASSGETAADTSEQQHSTGLVMQLGVQQQLSSSAFGAALLLFQAQERALRAVHANLTGQSDNIPRLAPQERAWLNQYKYELNGVAERAAEKMSEVGVRATPDNVAYAILMQVDLAWLKLEMHKQLQEQGLDHTWHSVHSVADTVTDEDNSNGNSTNGAGSRQYGAYSAISRWARKQQQREQEKDVAVEAIKAGGRSMSELRRLVRMQLLPALLFLRQWWPEQQQLVHAASAWWYNAEGRVAWLKERQDATNPQEAAGSIAQHSNGHSMFTRGVNTLKQYVWGSSSTAERNSSDDTGSCLSGCPLCEQEKANAAKTDAGSNNCSVSAADPFRWRKLVWQLLGRLKPSAQAWYVQHYGMCHHCTDARLWECINRSLSHHIWCPPDSNPVEAMLAQTVYHSVTDASRPMRQYARALNKAFHQGRTSPSAPLLSQLVLLALSPLHKQLLPDTETAPFSPGSFVPAVNKVLMAQFGLGQALNHAVDKQGEPQMWHVWWHIGIRRYHWIKQQQQQELMGPVPAAAGVSKSSKARRKQQQAKQQLLEQQQRQGLQPLTPAELQQLYSDPAARYYAVGFASKQVAPYGIGLRANSAIQSPHTQLCWRRMQDVHHNRRNILLHFLAHGLQLKPIMSDRLEKIQQIIVHETEQLEQDEGSCMLFPPLFRPEGSLGAVTSEEAASEVLTETLFGNKAGEANHVLSSRHLLGKEGTAWKERYEELTQCCDCCQKELQQDLSCKTCLVPRYCSHECMDQDADSHAALCSYLLAAKQRYSPASSSSNSSLTRLHNVASGSPHHRWRVLDLLQPEPGPLGTDCGALS